MKTTFILHLFVSLFCVIGGSLSAMEGSAIKQALEAMPTPNDPALNQQLVMAALRGNLEQVKTLVRNGANVNAQFLNTTPLIMAASDGNNEMVDFLLNNKANINAQDSFGDTPLFSAASAGHLSTVRLLLSRGADPQIPNRMDRTPLEIAIANNHPAVVELIQNYINSQSSAQLQPSPEVAFGS